MNMYVCMYQCMYWLIAGGLLVYRLAWSVLVCWASGTVLAVVARISCAGHGRVEVLGFAVACSTGFREGSQKARGQRDGPVRVQPGSS